jgi:hypothetical protein
VALAASQPVVADGEKWRLVSDARVEGRRILLGWMGRSRSRADSKWQPPAWPPAAATSTSATTPCLAYRFHVPPCALAPDDLHPMRWPGRGTWVHRPLIASLPISRTLTARVDPVPMMGTARRAMLAVCLAGVAPSQAPAATVELGGVESRPTALQ